MKSHKNISVIQLFNWHYKKGNIIDKIIRKEYLACFKEFKQEEDTLQKAVWEIKFLNYK